MNEKYKSVEDEIDQLQKNLAKKDTQIAIYKSENKQNVWKLEKMHVDLSYRWICHIDVFFI